MHSSNMPQMKSNCFEKEVATAITRTANAFQESTHEEARSLSISHGKSLSSPFLFQMDGISHSNGTMNDMSNSSLSPSSMKEELMFSSHASEMFFTPLPECWDDDSSTDTPHHFEPSSATQTPSPSKFDRQSHRVHLKLRMRPSTGMNMFDDRTSSTVEYEKVCNAPLIDEPRFDLSTPPLTPIRENHQVPFSVPELRRNGSSIDYQSVSSRYSGSSLPYLVF